MDQPDLHTWAVAGFTRFEEVWSFDDFWTRANTFEAYIRFVAAAEALWPGDHEVAQMRTLLAKMCDANHGYFDGHVNGQWADDFGWWGIASLAAWGDLLGIGNAGLAETYLQCAKTCWCQMKTRGWDSKQTARPVPHGCANGVGDPDAQAAKNTVTNANLLVLSVRLYQALERTGDPLASDCLDMACSQYMWFDAWLTGDYGYLRLVPESGGLVGERPMARPDYCIEDHPTWEPGWTWSGDQGLMLGGLAGLLEIEEDVVRRMQSGLGNFDANAFEAQVNGWIATIVTGIGSLLFGSDKIVREAPFESAFGYAFGADYVGGRGVLLRYLTEASVRPYVGAALDGGIAATAAAVWASRTVASNQFQASWVPGDDSAFQSHFKSLWGEGDVGVTWSLPDEDPGSPIIGILQAAGLDALGAAIARA